MALGTIIGLIPANALGAGKMIEELQRRGMLQSPSALRRGQGRRRYGRLSAMRGTEEDAGETSG